VTQIVVKHYEWRGPLVQKVVTEASRVGVVNAAEHVLADAYPYVPYEDGDLRDSGRAQQDRDLSGRYVAEAFVSYDTPYAVKLHEHPNYNFKGSGEGKWLEHALQRRASRMADEDMAPPLIKALAMP